MRIKNLSSAQTFGTVIASLPDDMPCTSHCCVRASEPIKEWLSQEPVVLDYVSGMPLLVIYEAESYSLYYRRDGNAAGHTVRAADSGVSDFCPAFLCGRHYQRYKWDHRAWHHAGIRRDPGWRDAAHGVADVYVPRRQSDLADPYLSGCRIRLFSYHVGSADPENAAGRAVVLRTDDRLLPAPAITLREDE